MNKNMIKLIDDKTEFLIVSGDHQNVTKFELQIRGITIDYSKSVWSPGVTFDTSLSMRDHINLVYRSSCYYLRRISKIHLYLSSGATENLYMHSFHVVWTIVILYFPLNRMLQLISWHSQIDVTTFGLYWCSCIGYRLKRGSTLKSFWLSTNVYMGLPHHTLFSWLRLTARWEICASSSHSLLTVLTVCNNNNNNNYLFII